MVTHGIGMRENIIILIGTKAQLIKMAPVLKELDGLGVPYSLIYTGQHSETFDELEACFQLKPADLNLVPQYEASTKLTFFKWIKRYWRGALAKRDLWRRAKVVVVHGDTASTLFGALTGKLFGAKVAHVEAGLRSERLFDPFPEEIIRRFVSVLSDFHYVPDDVSEKNLNGKRGIIHTKGNTIKDALTLAIQNMKGQDSQGGAGGYAIASIHRNENLSNAAVLDFILDVLHDISKKCPVYFVLHPATREKLKKHAGSEKLFANERITLAPRMDYFDFIKLQLGARFLVTDGGSNQEEAALLGIPTLLMRKTTERMDGLESNVVLSRLDRSVIHDFIEKNADAKWNIKTDHPHDSPSNIIARHLEKLAAS